MTLSRYGRRIGRPRACPHPDEEDFIVWRTRGRKTTRDGKPVVVQYKVRDCLRCRADQAANKRAAANRE